jgi:hypothetical protein
VKVRVRVKVREKVKVKVKVRVRVGVGENRAGRIASRGRPGLVIRALAQRLSTLDFAPVIPSLVA